MQRNIILVISVFLLFGCATVGPSTQGQGPDLQNEYELARAAIEEARQWEAPKYRPDQFQAAVDRLEEVRTNQDQMLPEKAMAEYRQVQILANQATIDSLLDQMDEQDARITRLEEARRDQRAQMEKLKQRTERTEEKSQKRQEQLDQVRVQSQELKQQLQQMEQVQSKMDEKRQELRTRLQRLRDSRNRLRDQIEHQEQQIQDQQEELQQVRSRLEDRSKQVRELKTEREKIAEEFREKLDKATVREEERGVVVNIQEKVLFDLGKAEIKPRARRTLGSIASVLKNYPEREIRVEGHTDTLPINTPRFPSNWELSSQRALNVLKFLTERHGLNRERIAAVAYGEYRPLVPNTSPENRRRNRRVEIVLVPPDLPRQSQDVVQGEG